MRRSRGRERSERRPEHGKKNSTLSLPSSIPISLGFAAAVNYLKSGSPPGSDAAGPTPAWAADLAHPPATAFELRRRAAAAGEAFPADEVRKKREREREREGRRTPQAARPAHSHTHTRTHARTGDQAVQAGGPGGHQGQQHAEGQEMRFYAFICTTAWSEFLACFSFLREGEGSERERQGGPGGERVCKKGGARVW